MLGCSLSRFPTNSVLRAKCLNAIGRPNWDPPSYTRICSEHFDHFINETNGTDQKNDTLLMKDIPVSFFPYKLKVQHTCQVLIKLQC